MIMDLLIQKRKHQKGFKTSQQELLSPQPVFRQPLPLFAVVTTVSQIGTSITPLKMFLTGTNYSFIE